MNQYHTPAELNALRESYMNYIKAHAPEGVNLRTARKSGQIHIYILNAPAPLYDFTEYGDGVRCVELGKAAETNAAAAELLGYLKEITVEWSAILSARAFVGSPSQSFAPIAKNTPRARAKAAPVEVVEPAPVEVVEPAPVEVSNARPVRRSLGRMLVRLLAAVLLVIINALRVAVALLRLVERGRLGEVARYRVALRLRLYRARSYRVRAAVLRRVQGVRLMLLYRVEVSKEHARARIYNAVEVARRCVVVVCCGVAQRVERGRASIVEAVKRAGVRVVAVVEGVRRAELRARGRVVHGVGVAALSLTVIARRLDLIANNIESI